MVKYRADTIDPSRIESRKTIMERLDEITPEQTEEYRRLITGEADNDIIRLSVLNEILRELRMTSGRSLESQKLLGEVMRAALKRTERAA